MSRTTMFAATALAIGLATSATPAMASTTQSATPFRAQVVQNHDHHRHGDWRHSHWGHHHGDWRHHHGRFFALGGVIEDIDLAHRQITIDPRRGPDRTVELARFTRVTRDGDRVSVKDLAVGDRAFVRGVKKHGERWAIRIDARS
jgi:hypothetical protein